MLRKAVPSFVSLVLIALVGCDPSSEPGDEPPSQLRFPLDNWLIIQEFGVWNENFQGFHLAEDLDASPGTAVYAVADGIVGGGFSGSGVSGYGAVMMIQHEIGGETVTALYGHLSTRRGLQVEDGERVRAGQVIGFIAADDEDGGSWGPHLHFGIRKGPYDINARVCGMWLYVGYTRQCSAVSHEEHRDRWHDPTDFLRANGARRLGPVMLNGRSPSRGSS